MEFCGFVEKLEEEVRKLCGNMGEVEVQKITGNNGVMRTAMNMTVRGKQASPIIYLKPYYENYREGRMSVKSAAEEIYTVFKTHEIPFYVNTVFDDFERLRDKIIYQLVDYGRNRDMLEDMPHIRYCDLAVVFCLILENSENGRATALIHNEHMKMWGTDINTLYELAKMNTPRLLPAEIKTMAKVMKEIAGKYMGSDWGDAFFEDFLDESIPRPLYVLSNRDGMKGAAVILYEGVLKMFAEKIGHDLFILPSSVHEVLLVPYEESTHAEELEELVKMINLAEVPEEDVLSDHVYLYSRKTDQVMMAFGGSVEAEGN